MPIKGLFDIFNRAKRTAKAKVNDRLSKIKADRIAAENAPRGKGGKFDTRTPNEKAAAAARRGSDNVTNSDLGRFLFLGEPCTNFKSSCVKAFWYDMFNRIMHVQFLDESVYGYGVKAHNVNPEMASSMFRSKSKGSFIWDNFRLRGTRLGHKIDYVLELSPPGGRLWEQSDEAAAEHAAEVNAQSIYDRFTTSTRPVQNVGRGEPEMHAPRSKRGTDDMVEGVDQRTGLPRMKSRLPEPG